MKSVFNKFDSYVLVINYNGDIVFANDKLLKRLKYKDDLYKLKLKDILVNKDDFDINMLETSKDIKIDLNFYSKDKEIIKLYSNISIDYFEKNECIFIISKDIKYKYYTIEDLENLLDKCEVKAYIKDKNSRYLYVNKAFAGIFLKNKDDIIGLSMRDYANECLVNEYESSDREIINSREDRSCNQRGRLGNGEEVWYNAYKSPVYDEDGEFKYMACTLRDITLEKVVKDGLYKNYNQITNLTNLDTATSNFIDMSNLLKRIGEKIVDRIGADGLSILLYDKEKNGLIPYTVLNDAKKAFKNIDFIPIKSEQGYESMVNGKFEGLTKVEDSLIKYDENPQYLPNLTYVGSYRIRLYNEFIGILNISYKCKCTPVYNQEEFMKSICNSIAMIIKNSRLLQEVILENEKRESTEQELELYLSTAVDLVSIFDENGNFLKINSNWTKLLGWSEDELINHSYREFMHPEDIKDNIYRIDMLGTPYMHTNRYLHKNGEYIWLDWRLKYDDEKKIIVGTAKDITEKMNIEKQKKKLEEKVHLESIKNEFFANISHEFKTPINIILGTMQLTKKNIENNKLNSESLFKYIDTIRQNSYRLLRLVNNLIDISKVDIGYYNLNPSNNNIVSIIEYITLSVVDYVEDKNIELIFDTDIEEVITACDPDKIERVILNLLSNAIKYTPNNGIINVNITSDLENVIVSIKDSGVGIPSDKLDVIFDRFRQANNLLTRRCEGSGIGLSLVKAIVEMHGGNIQVYSNVNKGTEFVFNIPIRLLDKEDEHVHNYDSKDFHVEKCHIEFSDIYSL